MTAILVSVIIIVVFVILNKSKTRECKKGKKCNLSRVQHWWLVACIRV